MGTDGRIQRPPRPGDGPSQTLALDTASVASARSVDPYRASSSAAWAAASRATGTRGAEQET